MWWQDLLWGFWNGITAWVVLICHVVNVWENQPVYDILRQGEWYDFGFLLGAGSPFLGTLGGGKARREPKVVYRRTGDVDPVQE
jgi:hypothetical protein